MSVTPSHLGFGCSRLMGSLPRRQADRLLETSLALGITHFDVARSYGSGEAERVVGSFAKRHDDVTITTKFGIAPSGAQQSQMLRGLARGLMRRSPALRRRLQDRGARMVTRGRFDLAAVQASVETSLTTLGLSSIHAALLHDPLPTDILDDETLDWLQERRAAGVIGVLGIGTGHDAARVLIEAQPAVCGVVQVPHSIDASARDVFRTAVGRKVAFGVLSESARFRVRYPHRVERAMAAVGAPPDDEEALGVIALADAVSAGADKVLISTTNPDRLLGLPKRLETFGSSEVLDGFRAHLRLP
jgi:D-threo-aldose 1-dehydrogenase